MFVYNFSTKIMLTCLSVPFLVLKASTVLAVRTIDTIMPIAKRLIFVLAISINEFFNYLILFRVSKALESATVNEVSPNYLLFNTGVMRYLLAPLEE